MKATGIVRRIDDLGRIVIPKEIRRTLRIREGDPLEIYTDREGEVIFKKYSPVGEMGAFAAELCDSVAKVSNCTVAVTDRDSVIAAAGMSKKEVLDRRVSRSLEAIMEKRSFYQHSGEKMGAVRDNGEYYVSCAMPIQCAGDIVGCVVPARSENDGKSLTPEVEHKLIQTAASFLGKQLEE